MSDQRSEHFDEPTFDTLPVISRQHVASMEASTDEATWVFSGIPHIVLTTIGRRSGKPHKVALGYWRDPGGHRIIAASFLGAARHPAWYLNLVDRAANPLVHVRERELEVWAEPIVLTGAERERTWAALVRDRPYFATYQQRTARAIPLVRLLERPSAGAPS